MKKIIYTLLASVILTSCVSSKAGVLVSTAKAPLIETSTIQAEVTVDHSKKITGTSTSSYFLGIKVKGDNNYIEGMKFETGSNWGNLAQLKSAATYEALKDSTADLIIHPQYKIKTTKSFFFKTVTVTVNGYAGFFTNFKQKEFCNPCQENLEFNMDIKTETK